MVPGVNVTGTGVAMLFTVGKVMVAMPLPTSLTLKSIFAGTAAGLGVIWYVHVGLVVSSTQPTVLSPPADAVLPLPDGSIVAPAGTVAMTVPEVVMPVTATL